MARRNNLAQKALRRSERAATADRRLAIQDAQDKRYRRLQKAIILAKELDSRRKFEKENPQCSSDSMEPAALEKIQSPLDSSDDTDSTSESSLTPSEPSSTT